MGLELSACTLSQFKCTTLSVCKVETNFVSVSSGAELVADEQLQRHATIQYYDFIFTFAYLPLFLFLFSSMINGPGDFHVSCLVYQNSCKTYSICKEFIGYTSNDIEIFITAYEITASIVKQTRAYRAHPLFMGQNVFGTKMDRGLMRDIN